jgi:hypothetical protein
MRITEPLGVVKFPASVRNAHIPSHFQRKKLVCEVIS